MFLKFSRICPIFDSWIDIQHIVSLLMADAVVLFKCQNRNYQGLDLAVYKTGILIGRGGELICLRAVVSCLHTESRAKSRWTIAHLHHKR